MAPNKSEKLPVAANFEVLQARIDLAIAKREAIVKSWVDKYDTSRCAPSKTKEEIEAWDAELFNPMPSNLGLGAAVPKEYMNGDINRKDISGNSKLRSLMLGKKGGLLASKSRNAEEKAISMKRGLKADSSDEEEGRSSLGKSKKAKREAAEATRDTITSLPESAKQYKPLPLQQNAAIPCKSPVDDLNEDDDSKTASHPFKATSKPSDTEQMQPKPSILTPLISESLNSSEMNKPKVAAAPTTGISIPEFPTKTLSEIEARREKNRLKKSKQKERKRKEKEQALAAMAVTKDTVSEE